MGTPDMREHEGETIVETSAEAGTGSFLQAVQRIRTRIMPRLSMLLWNRNREQPELFQRLEAQYPEMRETLEANEIDTEGVPSWKTISRALTPEVLAKVLKMKEPILLLVPPNSRQEKMDALYQGRTRAVHTRLDELSGPGEGETKTRLREVTAAVIAKSSCDLASDALWNGGKKDEPKKWRVEIVEGPEEMQMDPATHIRNNIGQMAAAEVRKYTKLGLDVIDNAGTYLMLAMRKLHAGETMDQEFFTVLNSKNMQDASVAARGHFALDRVVLDQGDSADQPSGLYRVRGKLTLDLSVSRSNPILLNQPTVTLSPLIMSIGTGVSFENTKDGRTLIYQAGDYTRDEIVKILKHLGYPVVD